MPFNRLLPFAGWHQPITRASLSKDTMAGLTNAAIVLPQGVAFAVIAGMPPEYGLFTAIVVTVVAAIWGSSAVMVSGPTTAISAIVATTLATVASPGTPDYVAAVMTMTILVGLLQLASGFAGLGGLISFVSHSVIVGFTAAAAILIAVSQIPGVLGIPLGHGGIYERVAQIGQNVTQINLISLSIAAITLVSLIGLSRLDRRIPSYIIALAIGATAGILFEAPASGVSMFSPLASSLPAFTTPDVSPMTVSTLLPGAAAIAFVALLEAISIGKSFALRRGETYDSNQEIVGQGLSNGHRQLIGSCRKGAPHLWSGGHQLTRDVVPNAVSI